ncbi:MAG: hypothetical protein AAF098_14875, partial [Pseudomonadota bacterium]
LRRLASQLEQLRLGAMEKQHAQSYYKTLEQRLDALHAAEAPLQTLLIKDVVGAMANLYYYVCLLSEGIHQQATDGDGAKLACAELFRRKYMSNNDGDLLLKDARYLRVCDLALGLDTP